jgi:hypothetical protein
VTLEGFVKEEHEDKEKPERESEKRKGNESVCEKRKNVNE